MKQITVELYKRDLIELDNILATRLSELRSLSYDYDDPSVVSARRMLRKARTKLKALGLECGGWEE